MIKNLLFIQISLLTFTLPSSSTNNKQTKFLDIVYHFDELKREIFSFSFMNMNVTRRDFWIFRSHFDDKLKSLLKINLGRGPEVM